MNDIELATYLSEMGYDVHEEQGYNIEALFHEGLDSRPINYSKLDSAAASEGYLFTGQVWEKNVKVN